MKLKINWSGKSHNFNYKEKKYLLRVLDSDNLTQGRELVKFENFNRAFEAAYSGYSTRT